MIGKDDRVASVLAKDESLIDVFVSVSPSFSMLRNKAARRTMARLVTIEQAARVAGVEVQALLDKLNQALGHSSSAGGNGGVSLPRAEAPLAPPPPGLLETPEGDIVDLDVREDLRQGKEPFRIILQAAQTLPEGKVFRLRAIFEPAPLYAVLGRLGLGHYTEKLAADDWRVWFYRDANAKAEAAKANAPEPPVGDDGDVVILDVRGLEPPEPMVRTLEALAELPRGKTLVQLNVRVPQFLIPRLEEQGFTYEVREQSTDLVRLFIRHKEA